MITLERPSVALNSCQVDCSYTMERNLRVGTSHTRTAILDFVVQAAAAAPGGRLRNLVVNAHGRAGYFELGTTFWDRTHTHLFRRWAGKVEKIWLQICGVAEIVTPRAVRDGDGNLFCSEIARAAQAYVVASTETQRYRGTSYPPDQIDSFEGLVLFYNPGGGVDASRRRPSHNWSGE